MAGPSKAAKSQGIIPEEPIAQPLATSPSSESEIIWRPWGCTPHSMGETSLTDQAYAEHINALQKGRTSLIGWLFKDRSKPNFDNLVKQAFATTVGKADWRAAFDAHAEGVDCITREKVLRKDGLAQLLRAANFRLQDIAEGASFKLSDIAGDADFKNSNLSGAARVLIFLGTRDQNAEALTRAQFEDLVKQCTAEQRAEVGARSPG